MTKKSQLTTRKTTTETRNGPRIPKPQNDYKKSTNNTEISIQKGAQVEQVGILTHTIKMCPNDMWVGKINLICFNASQMKVTPMAWLIMRETLK